MGVGVVYKPQTPHLDLHSPLHMCFIIRRLLPVLRVSTSSSSSASLCIAPRPSNYFTRRTLATASAMSASALQKEYRLKLVTADLKDGDKVEVELEGLEGAKVLLLKANGSLRAVGTKCTRAYSRGLGIKREMLTGMRRLWYVMPLATTTADWVYRY